MITTPRIENVIKHCHKLDTIYSQQTIYSQKEDDNEKSDWLKDRWINRGWLEALRFVQQNYIIERR